MAERRAASVAAAGAVALLLLLSPATGQFIFRAERCNTNFNNPNNWENGRSPARPASSLGWQPPSTVRLYDSSSPRSVDSLVTAGEYEAGTLEFGPSTTLTLAGEGIVFTFKTSGLGEDATFTAGQKVTKECDLGCSSNYVTGTQANAISYLPDTLPPATTVPCSSSTVYFPAGYQSKVFAYSVYDFNRVFMDGKSFSTTASLFDRGTSAVHFVPPTPNIRLGDTDECIKENLFDASIPSCICFDSCSAKPEDLSKLANAAMEASSEIILAQTMSNWYNFDYTFELASTTMSDYASCLADESKQEVIQHRLRWFGGIHDINVTVTQEASTKLRVKGTAYAQMGSFQNEVRAYNFVGSAQPSVPTGPNNRLDFVFHIWAKLIETAGDCVDTNCYNLANQALKCGSQECPAVFGAFYTLSSPAYNLKKNLQFFLSGNYDKMLLVSGCADSSASPPCQSALDAIKAFMTPVRDFSAFGDWTTRLEECGLTSTAFELAVPQPPPTRATVTGYFGRSLLQGHVNMLLDTNNRQSFAHHIAAGLTGYGRIVHVDRDALLQSLRIGLPTVGRRDPAADQPNLYGRATKLVYMSITYTVYGGEITADSLEYNDLMDWIEALVNTYKLVTHTCFIFETASFSQSCLAAQLNQAYANGCVTLECLRKTVLDIIGCGLAGADSEGNCLDSSSQDNELADTLASQAQAENSGSSSGASIIPIAAGAAAGVLLIVIVIIIVVVRRKGGSGARTGSIGREKADRTVVAFENPMYDDPEPHNGGQPVYDSTEHEDLYDEPAFNLAQNPAKSNPMYESAEDLADPKPAEDVDLDEGGGYLDVAPDENPDE